jgi:uncharacterized SAM-binding protein YcdF (DUF218 family)
MPPRRRRGALLLAVLAALLALGLAFWRPFLVFLADYPDIGQAPARADAVVVLAGGWQGERILKAGDLVRAGYAPYALVSGPSSWYGIPECEGAMRLAERRGYPKEYFVCAPNEARSTREEAAALAGFIRERKLRRILLVSVSTHLRRATTLMREAMPGVTVIPVSAKPLDYDPARWWEAREGRKALFYEWLKLLTGPFGI